MPRSDFVDLLQILIKCSEYLSSCTEKRSKLTLGMHLLQLWIGFPFVKTKTFLWAIYICGGFFSLVMLLWDISILYSCQQYSRASKYKFCCSWWAFDQTSYRVAGERTSWWHEQWKSRVGWIRVVRQKKLSLCYEKQVNSVEMCLFQW